MIDRGRRLDDPAREVRVIAGPGESHRLDRFILTKLPWRSRTRVQRLIRDGGVLLDGQPAKPSSRVHPGAEVVVELSDGTGVPDDYDTRDLDILWEDDWILAIDKPAGLLVHPVGRHVYDTLLNYIHHRAESDGEFRPRLCHRIDKDTTGIVVVAKDAWVHRELMIQFERRRVRKRYLALVDGEYPVDEETIEIAIGEGRDLASALDHRLLRPSVTHVRVLERDGGFSLLACEPRTGRQNQIRIHLAARGFPISGDGRFGSRRCAPGLPPRHLLHAERLVFHHPRLKAEVELTAPRPADFRTPAELRATAERDAARPEATSAAADTAERANTARDETNPPRGARPQTP